MTRPKDLIVVGGGAAGTAAALEARRRGLDVVLVEGRQRTPREHALIALAEDLAQRPLRRAPAERRAEGLRQAVRRAGEQASAFLDQREAVLARRGVERVLGRARLPGDPGVVVVGGDQAGEHRLAARHVLLASGSRPLPLIGPGGTPRAFDPAWGLLDADESPPTACVVGGGRHGVVLAGLLACAGSQVTLVETGDRLLSHADADVAAAVLRALRQDGVDACLGTSVDAIGGEAGAWTLPALPSRGPFARVHVAVGRSPDLSEFGEGVAAAVSAPRPAQEYGTAWPWLCVAGEASGRRMTAEAARREGRAAVLKLLGESHHVPAIDIPVLVAGSAACGWAGLTEGQAVARGLALRVGRARVAGRGALAPGFVKLLADAGSGRLLGVHVFGHGREAVALGAALIELGVGLPELAAMAFPAGTGAAALAEAAEAAV